MVQRTRKNNTVCKKCQYKNAKTASSGCFVIKKLSRMRKTRIRLPYSAELHRHDSSSSDTIDVLLTVPDAWHSIRRPRATLDTETAQVSSVHDTGIPRHERYTAPHTLSKLRTDLLEHTLRTRGELIEKLVSWLQLVSEDKVVPLHRTLVPAGVEAHLIANRNHRTIFRMFLCHTQPSKRFNIN